MVKLVSGRPKKNCYSLPRIDICVFKVVLSNSNWFDVECVAEAEADAWRQVKFTRNHYIKT